MPAKPRPRKTSASAAEGVSLQAARQELSELLPQAIELLGATPQTSAVSDAQTIALPVGSGTTVVGALRNRPNWYLLARREIDRLARIVTERNWFARTVHDMRVDVYAQGFRFKDAETRKWVEEGTYDFGRYVRDMIEEFHVSKNIVVWWKKGASADMLPALNVPNNGDVDYGIVGGLQQIAITVERNAKLKEEDKARMGENWWNAVKRGTKLVITEGDADYDFRVMKSGKSAAPFSVSPLVTIFDDLDFIEAVRIGDWNGAKARWEVIRHTKKGYSTSSGQNAGTVRNHAKAQDLKAIVKAMKEILGKIDIATNFDQDIGYVIFPKEHFHPELLAEVKQRLLHYGGVFAVMLLKTDSQITGLSEFMMQVLRTEVFAFRDRFDKFLVSIFKAESFSGSAGHDFTPAWPVKHLYSAKALNELIASRATYALNAPQSLRAILDIDDETESALMLEAHTDPKRYTPPYEPRQGISAALVVPDSTGGNQNQNADPGSPGRPASS